MFLTKGPSCIRVQTSRNNSRKQTMPVHAQTFFPCNFPTMLFTNNKVQEMPSKDAHSQNRFQQFVAMKGNSCPTCLKTQTFAETFRINKPCRVCMGVVPKSIMLCSLFPLTNFSVTIKHLHFAIQTLLWRVQSICGRGPTMNR